MPPARPECSTETAYGAFMEQSGRNRWQAVADGTAPKAAQTGENRCRWLRPVAVNNGKEGVDVYRTAGDLSLAAAARARTLVAAATGARLSDHSAMISRSARSTSFSRPAAQERMRRSRPTSVPSHARPPTHC